MTKRKKKETQSPFDTCSLAIDALENHMLAMKRDGLAYLREGRYAQWENCCAMVTQYAKTIDTLQNTHELYRHYLESSFREQKTINPDERTNP